MDAEGLAPISTRDIRSSSVPRLRQSSRREKYGGPLPNDAFVQSPGAPFPHVQLGKPVNDLTPAQKFSIAHSTVEPLIGKRVNRHNQRTGERNPWSYYRPGKRWAKRMARGNDVDTKTGFDIWSGEEDQKERVQIALAKAREANAVDAGHEPALGSSPKGTHRTALHIADAARPGRRKNRGRNHKDDWEFVHLPKSRLDGLTDEDVDDWDIVSACSAPD